MQFYLTIHIEKSRWFENGGKELLEAQSKDPDGNPLVDSEGLSNFLNAATAIPYWVDPDEKNNPKMEHTISWLPKA